MLKKLPQPPDLDAGEGVRMMYETMGQAELYPPIFLTRPDIPEEAVIVFLLNELRPGVWDQVYQYLLKNKDIGNAEVRKILRTDDHGFLKIRHSCTSNSLLFFILELKT